MTASNVDLALPDKRAVRRAFDRAAAFDGASAVHDEARSRLLERLDFFRLEPELIVDLGSATGRGAGALAARFPAAKVLALDVSLSMLRAARGTRAAGMGFVGGDAESLPLGSGTVQLIFANLCLPFCRPDRVFAEAARVLAAGGLLVFSTVGPDTLQEVRRAWAGVDDRIHVHAAFDLHDLGDLALSSGLEEPVVDVDRLRVSYRDVAALVGDLRACGAVNTAAGRRRGLTGAQRWRAFERRLGGGADAAGRLTVSVELVLGQAWGRGPGPRGVRDPGEIAIPVDAVRHRSSG